MAPPASEISSSRKLFSRTNPLQPEDEIVITGVSGRFPNADNVAEFSDNLYNKVIIIRAYV
jgi:hypothetical protein